MQQAVADALSIELERVVVSTRERIKYQSVTLKFWVTDSHALYRAYEAIDRDARVKFKF